MRFIYPARLQRASPDEVDVSFRDLPECLTCGTGEADALAQAADALEEAIAGRMNRTDVIPVPSPRLAGEYLGDYFNPCYVTHSAAAIAVRTILL